jgi:hypothetical protein
MTPTCIPDSQWLRNCYQQPSFITDLTSSLSSDVSTENHDITDSVLTSKRIQERVRVLAHYVQYDADTTARDPNHQLCSAPLQQLMLFV